MNALPAAERLKDAVSIASVIGRSIELKRDGKLLKALCPFHAERTPSFYVYGDHFHCFGCGAHGDVFAWLMQAHRMTFPQAVQLLAAPSGEYRTIAPAPACGPKPGATTGLFMRCWEQGRDPAGTLVETYLDCRGGLRIPDGAPIRFHPRCQRGPRELAGGPEFWPAMLALMTDPVTGAPVGVHRTYLQHDGRAKAPVTVRGDVELKAKRIMGTWGVVRLFPDEEIGCGLGIAEGIENALTAAQIIGWGLVWAAGNRDALAKFPPLLGIDFISIFADADDSGVGIQAAQACAERWTLSGREALIHIPPVGTDWNDATRKVFA